MSILAKRTELERERPVERVMETAFRKMRNLVDADVIVGTPILTADGASIIPINKVTMGFLTGGGEYGSDNSLGLRDAFPFAGGSGAGMTVSPMCFLVSDGTSVKVISTDEKQPADKLLSLIPETIGNVIKGLSKNDKKKDK